MEGGGVGYVAGMTPSVSALGRRGAEVGGGLLAAVIAPLGKLRDAKPLHPRGAVHAATLDITDPAPSLGVALFSELGPTDCLVRVSRAVGLPPPWPDIGGIAVRLRPQAPEGSRCDLLFAGTGSGRVTRWLLAVRREPVGGTLTTLLPMRSVAGAVQFVLEPDDVGQATTYRLGWAHPGDPWQPLGRLVLGAEVEPVADPPLRFDPIVNPVEGLENYPSVRRLREPAYRLARKAWPHTVSPRRTAR